MFNDYLSTEAARERVKQRMQEAEAYGLQKRLGFSDNGTGKLLFVIIVIIAVAAALLL